MISFLSTNIAAFLVRKKAVAPDMEQVCAYGIAAVISSTISFSLLFLLAGILGRFWEGLVFAFCFSPLRRFTGGYHANSYFSCKAIFLSAFILCVLLLPLFENANMICKVICTGILLLDFGVVIALAPIESKNKPLDDMEKRRFHRYAVRTAVVQVAVGGITLYLSFPIYGMIILTTTVVAIAMVVEIVKRRRCQNEKGSEQVLSVCGKGGN